MIHFLNLIRWKNLIMIALVQILIKYALLLPFNESHGVTAALSPFTFALLVIATLCIAAGGYIINDIYDIETDKVNKPNKVIINKFISEKDGYTYFMLCNIIGVGLGFYLAYHVNYATLFVIFFISSALLYIYSTALKQMFLIGNIVISIVVALSIMVVGIFELIPSMNSLNNVPNMTFLEIIRDYAIFAFLINLVREVIKDIEDINGDHKVGMQTMPIVLGRERANKVAFILSLIPLFSVVYYVVNNFFKQQILVGYFLIFVVAPIIYVTIKIFSAEQPSHYKHIGNVLKLVMLTGMLSMLVYPFILK
ncbi:geranylgeranylglycerol-phosphate geranylgeranyltransferase [Winogradskyella aquimaris]|uniref:Geranylgeranylglycerol-phosphate geranylgeranyltransferase n=1 Tax=Winogradskyella aquimaris TaxID=864074 RepID=A0ABU5ETI6_9FLAO|nr:geranylgeranylglycerol-phosphate geranylgeranyltransferase [Winogradskyella aquimaris]MDY2588017.1 geranylgeranylglycerol-phosphate geranylgeranyltransferase [Winogradskyella aquimaris]